MKKSTRSVSGYTPELDLHALTVDEAIPRLDDFLCEACSAGWQQVRIVHGKGTGVLKLETNRYLARHSLVRRSNEADRFHGGSGATEVWLKS
jgi:DNA-nicking Smr family endonuclease